MDLNDPRIHERTIVLHGQDVAYRHVGGGGPLLVLVHGVGQSSATWDAVLDRLGDSGHQVLAIDLPGHGRSSKGRGDYSLGALASTVRDLLDHLEQDRCVVVGHSLGGGVALQFAYQFPHRCDGLVLVASGGLGPDAFAPLRAASLPGAELVIPVISHPRVVGAMARLGRLLSVVGVRPEMLSPESVATLAELADPESRTAFLATIRGVVDVSGQRVSAVSKLPAAAHLPVLMVWGDRDRVIPLAHGVAAQELLPDSRLVVFPGAGHEPHRFDPPRFVQLLRDFVDDQQRSPQSR